MSTIQDQTTAPPPGEWRLTPEERQALNRGEVPPRFAEQKSSDAPTDKTPAAAAPDQPAPAPVADAAGDKQPKVEAEAPPAEVDPDEVKVDDKGVARDRHGRFVKHVPYERFAKVSARAKAAEERALRLMEEAARADERAKLAAQAPAAPANARQETATEPPDPEQDPFGFMRWQAARIAALEGRLGETAAQTQERLREAEAQRAYEQDIARARTQRPDIDAATKHLIEARAKQLVLANPIRFATADGSPNEPELLKQLADELRSLRDSALQAKRSPAEIIYQNALLFGYRPAQVANNQATNGASNGASKAIAEIEAINAGGAAAASMRGAGTTVGIGGELTPAKIAAMNPAEFQAARSAYIAKHGKDAWNKLIGY